MHRSGVSPGNDATLSVFIHTLEQAGRAVVSRQESPSMDPQAVAALQAFAARACLELAGEPPALCLDTAIWAARVLYGACRAAAFRDLSAAQVKAAVGEPCPTARGPAADWSADLLFRHLPAVLRLGRELSSGDPLVAALRELAAAWPLSSVGLTGLPEVSVDTFFGHPALRRLYADRILAAGDFSRLKDPRVAELLRADLGAYPELAPGLARALAQPPADSGARPERSPDTTGSP